MTVRNFLSKQMILLFILSLIICKEETNKLKKDDFNSILSYLLEEEDTEEEKEKEKENEYDNIDKLKKILNENPEEDRIFDLLFLVDATGSMGSYIQAAKDETENISKELRKLYPEYNFQYGYIFYRDPIDSPSDIHEIIDLTDQVNTLPERISKIKANGGGDIPEDWVGAYKIANEKINWRNGLKVIIHLADAGAHGREFTLYDKYPLESDKLKKELLKCSKNEIKIFGFIITEDARNSFDKCQNYYKSRGGSYEIYNFENNNEKPKQHYYHRTFAEKTKIPESKVDYTDRIIKDPCTIPIGDNLFAGGSTLDIKIEGIPEYLYSDTGVAGVSKSESHLDYHSKTRKACYGKKESSIHETQENINSIFKENVISSIKKVLD